MRTVVSMCRSLSAACVAIAACLGMAVGPPAAGAFTAPIQRISVDGAGLRLPGSSENPDISADGDTVAFSSDADLTGSGATTTGVYVRHIGSGQVERLGDGFVIGISDDGRYVAAADGDQNGFRIYDLPAGTARSLPLADPRWPGTALLYGASLSGNGRFLTFGGAIAIGENSGREFLIVDDLVTGTRSVIPADGSNMEWPTISDDGRYLAFEPALAFHPVKVLDRQTGQIVFDPPGLSSSYYTLPQITRDGRKVLFGGEPGGPGSGVHALVGDVITGQVTDLTPGETGSAFTGRWDSSGRFATFTTSDALDPADEVAQNDADVYVYDSLTGQSRIASTNALGTPGGLRSGWFYRFQGYPASAISDDGSSVVFASFADDLVADDGTGISAIEQDGPKRPIYRSDIYLKGVGPGAPDRPAVTCDGPPSGWHPVNVSVACDAAAVAPATLANAADAHFMLDTSVAEGEQASAASTNSRQVCDSNGACTTAGPITGIKIDRRPPAATITTPADGKTYTKGQSITASYGCDDGPGGSGIDTCVGPVASGAAVDTSAVGSHTFVVTATDNAGNVTTKTVSYTVSPAASDPCVASNGGSYCESVAQTPGLVNYWPLDGSAKPAVGRVTVQQYGTFFYEPGATADGGKALHEWNATGDWLVLTPSVDMSGRRPWTIEAWWKDGTILSDRYAVLFGNRNGVGSTGCQPSVCLYMTANQARRSVLTREDYVAAYPAWGDLTDWDSAFRPVWTHVAVTYDGTTLALYKDGVLKKALTSTASLPQNPVTRFLSGNDVYWDELAIYDRALSAAELRAHYENR